MLQLGTYLLLRRLCEGFREMKGLSSVSPFICRLRIAGVAIAQQLKLDHRHPAFLLMCLCGLQPISQEPVHVPHTVARCYICTGDTRKIGALAAGGTTTEVGLGPIGVTGHDVTDRSYHTKTRT